LKAKIPFGKKPKAEDDESEEIEEESDESSRADKTDATDISQVEEEEDDEPQSKSLVYKLKKKIQALQKKNVKLAANAADDEIEDAGADDQAAKKKKKSKMIQIAIGVCLVVFLASDYIIPTEEPVATPPALKKRPRPNKKVKPVDGTATTDEPKKDDAASTDVSATGTETTPVTETTSDSPVTVTSDTPTDVPIDSAPTDTTINETPADTATTPDTTTDTAVTEPVTPDTTIDTASVDTTTTETPVDNSVSEPSVDTAVNVDSIDGGETKTPGDESITDQILQDLEKQAKDTQPVEQKKEYVSPPDYEYRGRGLVYNCQGKHWACVDAPSYKTCEDNHSSVKYLKKKTECHPFNVYETPKGCESMQNRMVSSSAKTAFCAE